MPLLFSYGTLQQETAQLSTFGRLLKGDHDQLVGFKTVFVPIEDGGTTAMSGETHYLNAAFTGRNDSRVRGTVFEISESELSAADEYERPASYVRIQAWLASGKQVWVYVHADSLSALRSRAE